MRLISLSCLLIPTMVVAATPGGEASRDGMVGGRWSSAIKQFVGTAYEGYNADGGYTDQSPTAPLSKVWFTGGQGILNEILWPSVDTPQVKDSQFLITDGSSFFFEERVDAQSHVEWLVRGVPAFRVTTRDPQGRFQIQKTIFSDPDRDVVFQHVRIERNIPGLNFYYLHKPTVSNTPMGNSAIVSLDDQRPVGMRPRPARHLPAGLYAYQGHQAQAVVFSASLKQVSAGFVGTNDGWQDLHTDFRMDHTFETATRGNVAQTAWLNLDTGTGVVEFDVAIGFGSDVQTAGALARTSITTGFQPLLSKYTHQWSDYQDSLVDLSAASSDGGALFRASIAILKSSEDKTHAGAIVASPTIPWGNHQEDYNSEIYHNGSRTHQTGGYHMVWPRDLYQMATTFMAVGDPHSAIASLNFLRSVQYGPNTGVWQFGFRTRAKDGSFPQNCWTNGEVYWAGLQMDEVAMPIILAYRLWQDRAIQVAAYWDMIRRAADFIADFGPWSPQERWEEAFGASPSTIASEITALWTAAELADAMGDSARAKRYRDIGDSWSSKPGDNIESWTFTSSGHWGNGRYYTRIQGASVYDEAWNPNSDVMIHLANNAGTWRAKDVTDAGFLELVRFGIRPALDPAIVDSIAEIDETIRYELPGIGSGWKRYLHDRYNYADDTGAQTDGMVWPFFTGERAHYELQRALESGMGKGHASAIVAPYITTIEKMATPTWLLPEQIWDGGPAVGKPTGAATPLGWTHGEYIKLLRSRRDGALFDRLDQVAARALILNLTGRGH